MVFLSSLKIIVKDILLFLFIVYIFNLFILFIFILFFYGGRGGGWQSRQTAETDTDRETETETDRQTDRQTDRETDRQTDRQRKRARKLYFTSIERERELKSPSAIKTEALQFNQN